METWEIEPMLPDTYLESLGSPSGESSALFSDPEVPDRLQGPLTPTTSVQERSYDSSLEEHYLCY